jgi:hypothetical protein
MVLGGGSGGQTAHYGHPVAARSTFYTAMRIKYSAAFSTECRLMKWWEAGNVHCYLAITDAGSFKLYRGDDVLLATSASGLIGFGQWKHVEAKVVIHDSTGTIDVWVDGALVFSATGLDTKYVGSGSIDAVTIGIQMGSHGSVTTDICDVIHADSQIGENRVEYFPPTGAGANTTWTPSSGSNFQTVDETTPNPADYNSTDVVGEKDTFTAGNVPTTATILAVGLIALANKQDSGAATLRFLNRQSGTDYEGASFNPPFGSNGWFKEWFEDNPDTAAPWTPTEWNANEIGYKRQS